MKIIPWVMTYEVTKDAKMKEKKHPIEVPTLFSPSKLYAVIGTP
jgi:hypothetical protein